MQWRTITWFPRDKKADRAEQSLRSLCVCDRIGCQMRFTSLIITTLRFPRLTASTSVLLGLQPAYSHPPVGIEIGNDYGSCSGGCVSLLQVI